MFVYEKNNNCKKIKNWCFFENFFKGVSRFDNR